MHSSFLRLVHRKSTTVYTSYLQLFNEFGVFIVTFNIVIINARYLETYIQLIPMPTYRRWNCSKKKKKLKEIQWMNNEQCELALDRLNDIRTENAIAKDCWQWKGCDKFTPFCCSSSQPVFVFNRPARKPICRDFHFGAVFFCCYCSERFTVFRAKQFTCRDSECYTENVSRCKCNQQ